VETIKRIRATGVSIVWIEHIVHALLRVVDRMMAVDAGRKLIEGDPLEVMASDEVRSVYLGDDIEAGS
ncbi:MAG: ABC transporter ATP-binding protein, partial [Ilumatobacteraceae bacterium]